jgi:hypothetical protein
MTAYSTAVAASSSWKKFRIASRRVGLNILTIARSFRSTDSSTVVLGPRIGPP